MMLNEHGVAISVVMPVFNVAEFIEESVECVLRQTLADFELIIVDDGSTDSTPEILERLRTRDSRVRVFRQTNQGIVVALNTGISHARGKYVARADGDDLCAPDRFQKQYDYLESHSDVVMLCTNFFKLYGDGSRVLVELPVSHDELVRSLFVINRVMHASVMMRRHAILKLGGYQEEWRHLEDYEFWFRLASVGRIASLQQPLSTLRVHGASISARKEMYQVRKGVKLRVKVLQSKQLPLHYAVYLIKPAFKSLLPESMLASYRRVTLKRR